VLPIVLISTESSNFKYSGWFSSYLLEKVKSILAVSSLLQTENPGIALKLVY
jgi:hypothetical protein